MQIFKVKKMRKENASYECLSLIALESVIRVNQKNYRQALLEQCKYIIRKNKMDNFINNDLDPSDESHNGFDNRSDSGSND